MYLIDKNKVTADEQLQRMKALMSYGIKESKQPSYSSVEYGKVAADGKLYGIVREGAKYFIKVAKDSKGGLVSENFDYIGGFRNRKDNQFDSFASAQRYFGEKMMDINENVGSEQEKVIAEAWDLDAKKEVVEEQTKKIQGEIARQKQIMKNAVRISEGKKQECDMPSCPKTEELKVEKIDGSKPGAPFVTVPTEGVSSNEKTNIKGKNKKAVKESSETALSSRKNPDYMDKSNGTKIGKNAPYDIDVDCIDGAVADEDGGESVNETKAMHSDCCDSQNTPSVGTDKKGKTDPFEKTPSMNESLDDLDDEVDDDIEDVDIDVDGDDDVDINTDGDDDANVEIELDADEEPSEAAEYELEADSDSDNDITSRIDALESKMDKILDALNELKYDDDDELYPDDDEDTDEDDEIDYDDDAEGDDDGEIDYDDDSAEDDEDDEDDNVVESVSYKRMKNRMMNEANRLNDFGRHPAYQKRVMTLPANDNFKRDGQYDMNDSSVDGDSPYGQKKGSQAPFDHAVDSIEDAIVENVIRKLKKKIG